jgi:hypothetical protein
VKRIFFKKYDSSGKFPDGRAKLDIYFQSSDREEYVWTPDWEKGTRNVFLEAYRIEKLNVPSSSEINQFKNTALEVLKEEENQTNYKLLGIQLGEGLKGLTTVNDIGRIASAIFNFSCVSHHLQSITSSRSQLVYDWVMTLSEQPISETHKKNLLEQFISHLCPEDNPLRKII